MKSHFSIKGIPLNDYEFLVLSDSLMACFITNQINVHYYPTFEYVCSWLPASRLPHPPRGRVQISDVVSCAFLFSFCFPLVSCVSFVLLRFLPSPSVFMCFLMFFLCFALFPVCFLRFLRFLCFPPHPTPTPHHTPQGGEGAARLDANF